MMKLIFVLCLMVIVCDARPRPFSTSRSGPPPVPKKSQMLASKVSYEIEPAAAPSEVSESSEEAESEDSSSSDTPTYEKRQVGASTGEEAAAPVAAGAATSGGSGFGENDGQFKESSGASSREKISAAVMTKHSFETRPVEVPIEDIEPQIIEVEGGALPLEIHFKSSSSRIKVQQNHQSAGAGEVEETSSDEEPHRLVHTARIPVISEVREVIQPFRRVVQEIQPVVEEIHTIVAKGEPRRQFDRNQSKANRGGGSRQSPKERGSGAALSGSVSAGSSSASSSSETASAGGDNNGASAGGSSTIEQKRY